MDLARDTWLERSKQTWKLRLAQFLLVGGTAVGVLLFFQGRWPESFYGAMLGIAATPVAVALASFVRCPVCGYRVALNAPFGRWWSFFSELKECPECGDDGTNRPVAPESLPLWFQAAREVTAKERVGVWVRRRKLAVRIALVVVIVALGIWVSCGSP